MTAFVNGWLASELPFHRLALEAAAIAVMAKLGWIDGTLGAIGLGVLALSWIGIAGNVVQAQRAEGVLEEALREALGDDYRERLASAAESGDIAPELTEEQGAPVKWRRLLVPFLMSDPRVEAIKDIAYLPEPLASAAGSGRSRYHRLDVYRPKEQGSGRPVMLFLHGGAWVIGDKREQGLPMMLHLAAQGWVCVTANYRLSPKATFPDQLVDAKAALAWVKDNIADYGGDPSFVAVSGGSAGGHLAALVALTPNDPEYQPGFESADTEVQAAVLIYGVYDFLNREGLRGPGFSRFLLERSVMKTSPKKDRRAYEKASPMDRIEEGENVPPTFVVHGRNDSLVPVGEARSFVRLLREASARRHPIVYAELPGAQHAFEVFRSIRTAHVVDAMARFLAVTVSLARPSTGGTAPATPRPADSGVRRQPS